MLLHDVVVRAGARVERAVVDADAVIGPDARVGDADGEIVLIGSGQQVEGRVEAGAHLPAVSRDT